LNPMTEKHLAYYPGCTLASTAREIDEALHRVCERLDIRLETLPDWNCCGSSSVHAVRPQLAVSLAGRNLLQAQDMAKDMMVMCAGCLNRLRSAHIRLLEDPVTRRVNESLLGTRLQHEIGIHHLLDILPKRMTEPAYRGVVFKSLEGLRYTAYYGCLLAAPPELKRYPRLHGTIESIMQHLGAIECPWGYEAKCCGSFLSVARPDIVSPMVADILQSARQAGAECIVTACAMCQLNLELRSTEKDRLPVFSIVELAAYGMGESDWQTWFRKHLVDPMPLFEKRVLRRRTTNHGS